ncbi:translation initiation factor IF-2-like [Cebus imitator]|uniref:translation initiation factor IF-2-like n=1 Tax=Cebus imitator TaxID=2715852 RepID=UPI001899DFDF|nr:translation initiation factor IF-2-like [Cebus imitator]
MPSFTSVCIKIILKFLRTKAFGTFNSAFINKSLYHQDEESILFLFYTKTGKKKANCLHAAPTQHTAKYVFPKRAQNLDNAEKEGKGLPFPAWGPGWLDEAGSEEAQISTPCTSRPAPGPLASPPATKPSRRRSATTDSYGCSSRGHQGPTPGTSASGPRAPKHSPRRRGGGERGCRARHRGPGRPAGRPRTGGRQRRLAQAAATLTCRRPRAWAAAAASLVVVALARRLRPPPPRSLSLPPPPGLMRDPRFLLRKPRPGKGAPEPPKSRRSSPAAAACPRRGSAGPAWQGLQAASYSEEEPREAPPPAAERAGSAEVKPALNIPLNLTALYTNFA